MTTSLSSGTRIGPYELAALIGEGGMTSLPLLRMGGRGIGEVTRGGPAEAGHYNGVANTKRAARKSCPFLPRSVWRLRACYEVFLS